VDTEIAGFRGVDIAPFRQQMTPVERKKMLREKFPSTAHLNWSAAFDNDIDLLGHVLRDILRLDMAPLQSGRRPGLEEVEARPSLDRLLGRDPTDHPYSLLPFPATFRLLADGRSLRSLASKVGMAKSTVQRLRTGVEAPTPEEMERIAKSFHKQPAYFLEYRVQSITASIFDALGEDPETSIGFYERMWQAR